MSGGCRLDSGRRFWEGGEETKAEEEEPACRCVGGALWMARARALARREMGWDVSAFVWVAQVGSQFGNAPNMDNGRAVYHFRWVAEPQVPEMYVPVLNPYMYVQGI